MFSIIFGGKGRKCQFAENATSSSLDMDVLYSASFRDVSLYIRCYIYEEYVHGAVHVYTCNCCNLQTAAELKFSVRKYGTRRAPRL